MIYDIYSGNYQRFLKKIQTIKNKCAKYGNPFVFEELGSHYKDISEYELLTEEQKRLADLEGVKFNKIPLMFYRVNIEGIARINDWIYVGTIYPTENGNLIKKAVEIEIPELYYHCEITCEHCKKTIKRKFTYLIYNENTKEFKQVGKSCLRDYTHGLDAELIAVINSMIAVAEEFERDFRSYRKTPSFNVEKLIRITSEICRLNGGFTFESRYPTYVTAKNIYKMFENGYTYEALEELANKIDLGNTETENIVKKVYEFIENSDNENLKIMIKCDSVPLAFMDEVSKTVANFYPSLDKPKVNNNSEYYGKVGEKFEIVAKNFKFVTSFNGMYGYTNLYRFEFENSIFVYFSSSSFEDAETVKIKGTIKDHREYNGEKQTVVTRCKVESLNK